MAEVDYQREFLECLRRADRRDGCEIGHLFTWHWTRGWAEHLEAIGMLERTHDADWWLCDRCESVSAHVERRYVDDRGVHMAKICCRERGYHLDGRVLRHALVKVSMGPGPGDGARSADASAPPSEGQSD